MNTTRRRATPAVRSATNPSPADSERATIAFIAAMELHGNKGTKAARNALKRGADICAYGRRNTYPLKQADTALNAAVRKNAPHLLKVLLAFGADPNGRDENGFTALAVASERNAAWAVSPLVTAGGDPNAKWRSRTSIWTVLSLALTAGCDDAVEALLALPNLDLRSRRERSYLSYLFDAKTARSVKALVDAGLHPAPCTRPDDAGNQWYPTDWLMRANLHNRFDFWHPTAPPDPMKTNNPVWALRALLEAGTPVSSFTLMLAAEKGLENCLEVLDAQGLDWFAPHCIDGAGTTQTAFEALQNNHSALASRWQAALMERGVPVANLTSNRLKDRF